MCFLETQMKNYDLFAEAREGMRVLQNAERRMPHAERRKTLSFVIRVRKLSEWGPVRVFKLVKLT